MMQLHARDVDFAKWYTDVCRKAELMDYSECERIYYLSSVWLCNVGTNSKTYG